MKYNFAAQIKPAMEIVGYFASVLIGISLGMLGGGGSILTVPVLVYFFGIAPVAATTYSLFIVGASSFAGSIGYLKKKMVDLPVLFSFGLPSVLTIFITRRYILTAIPPEFAFGKLIADRNTCLMVALASLMVFASFSMMRNRKQKAAEISEAGLSGRWKVLLPSGIVIGFISGILGAGCGFIIIPALVLGVRLPMKTAIGTSLAIIAINSLTGFLFSPDYSVIDWKLFITISLIAIAGIFIGKRIAVKNSDILLKKSFAMLILFVAIWIFCKELFFF